MHEDPNVPNNGKKGRGVRLQAGMVIAIEPMVTMGSNHVSTGSDGWIVTTNDHLPAAHYENTVAITNDGPVILTTDAKVLGVRSKAEKCNKFHLVVEPLRSYYDTCIRVVEYSIAVVF